MKNFTHLVKTEPVLFTSAIQAVLALLSGTAVHLSAGQSGAILAVTTAILSLIAAASTKPFHVSTLTGFISAIVTLLVAFGIHGVQPGIVSSLNAALVGVVAIIVRLHVSPKATVTEANGAKEEVNAVAV
ncbi:MAG: hypothetical protein FWE35_03600 [Streptosporangiales bacterium]|nr:hypothetical protein [Streptosporangiales bacterium]